MVDKYDILIVNKEQKYEKGYEQKNNRNKNQ